MDKSDTRLGIAVPASAMPDNAPDIHGSISSLTILHRFALYCALLYNFQINFRLF